MSTDLKIELFAYFTFYKAWKEVGVKITDLNVYEYYKDELKPSLLEIFDARFSEAVSTRMMLFEKIYLEEFDFDKTIKWRSLYDVYDHVTKVCDREDLFGHLTIFERMIATCAFVQDLYLRIYRYNYINVVKCGYIIWAMYFDKFAEKFYEEGGWNKLKREVILYKLCLDVVFFAKFPKTFASYLQIMSEASLNYCQFKKAAIYENRKYKHKGRIHVSKLWVKFHIKHFEVYIRIPLSYGETADSIDIELLLQRVKLICSLLECGYDDAEILQDEFQEKFYSTGMLFSKPFDNNDKVKLRDDLRLEILRNSMIACKEFLESRKCFDIHFQSKCLEDIEKIVPLEMRAKTENVKKNSSEMDIPGKKSEVNIDRNSPKAYNIIGNETMNTRFDTNPDTSDKIPDFDLHYKNAKILFNNESEKDADYSSLQKEKRHFELVHAGKASSSNQKDVIQWDKMRPPKKRYSQNEVSVSYNIKDSSESPLKSSFDDNGEGYVENTEQFCAFSLNQMALSQREKNVITNKMSSPKDFLSVKEVTHNNDGIINNNRELYNLREEPAEPDTPKDFLSVKEVKHNDGSKNTNRTLDKLREEQADADVRNFLRMILVLGDKQGIQYVRETLCNSEEERDISQMKP